MKILLQRVRSASVAVAEERIGSIGTGVLLFVGFGRDDDQRVLRPMVDKVLNIRIFPDDRARMNRSLLDVRGEVLAIPQFTLYADTHRGRRPEFTRAMPAGPAEELFEGFLGVLRASGVPSVGHGRFGASMQVRLVNDGPVTLLLEN